MTKLTDSVFWYFCAACYHLVLWWPTRWMPWPLLPFAGMYGYSPTYADYIETMNLRRARAALGKGGE